MILSQVLRNHAAGQRQSKKVTFVLLAAAALSATAAAGDETWINPAIKDAITKGKSEYVLPAGTYTLTTSIIVPEGTRNFTLRGAGVGKTILKGDNVKLAYGIKVGISPVIQNNWGVANMTNIDIDNVRDGAATIKLHTATPSLKPGQYIGLWDDGYVTGGTVVGKQLNHAELARVLSISPDKKTIFLDRSVSREYVQHPRAALINSRVVYNITVKDISFDGTVPNITTDRNCGIVDIGLADNCDLTNLRVDHFSSRAVNINFSRSIDVNQVDVYDGLNPDQPGSAYGITVVKSRNVNVRNCYAENARHSFVAHNGSTDILFEDCEAGGDGGNFDTHGLDERRITWRRCKATGGLNVGNTGWLAGGKTFRIIDCYLGSATSLCPNTSDVVFQNTYLGGIHLYTKTAQTGFVPSGGRPQGATFNNCFFELPKTGLLTGEDFDTINLNDCYLEVANAPWGRLMTIKEATGNLNFRRCNFANLVDQPYDPIRVSTPSTTFKMVLDTCKLASSASATTGVTLDKTFGGTISMTASTFYSNNNKATFFSNLSTKSIGQWGNKVLGIPNYGLTDLQSIVSAIVKP